MNHRYKTFLNVQQMPWGLPRDNSNSCNVESHMPNTSDTRTIDHEIYIKCLWQQDYMPWLINSSKEFLQSLPAHVRWQSSISADRVRRNYFFQYNLLFSVWLADQEGLSGGVVSGCRSWFTWSLNSLISLSFLQISAWAVLNKQEILRTSC